MHVYPLPTYLPTYFFFSSSLAFILCNPNLASTNSPTIEEGKSNKIHKEKRESQSSNDGRPLLSKGRKISTGHERWGPFALFLANS